MAITFLNCPSIDFHYCKKINSGEIKMQLMNVRNVYYEDHLPRTGFRQNRGSQLVQIFVWKWSELVAAVLLRSSRLEVAVERLVHLRAKALISYYSFCVCGGTVNQQMFAVINVSRLANQNI